MKAFLILAIIIAFSIFNATPYSELDWAKSKWNTITATTFSQISGVWSGNNVFYYKGDALFTGKVWSNDGRSMKMIVKHGSMTDLYLYHNNGEVAMHLIGKNGEYYYTEDGRRITHEDFEKQYEMLVDKFILLQDEIKEKE